MSKWTGNKYHSSKVHFSFGNEERVMKSSYQVDFNSGRFQVHRMGKPKPPQTAEILPPGDEKSERSKWSSMTMADFVEWGKDSRRRVYETSLNSLKNTKELAIQDNGLLKEDQRLSEITQYNVDFKEPYMYVDPIPNLSKRTKKLPEESDGRKLGFKRFESVAQHSFQWPSADGIRLPPHISDRIRPPAHIK